MTCTNHSIGRMVVRPDAAFPGSSVAVVLSAAGPMSMFVTPLSLVKGKQAQLFGGNKMEAKRKHWDPYDGQNNKGLETTMDQLLLVCGGRDGAAWNTKVTGICDKDL